MWILQPTNIVNIYNKLFAMQTISRPSITWRWLKIISNNKETREKNLSVHRMSYSSPCYVWGIWGSLLLKLIKVLSWSFIQRSMHHLIGEMHSSIKTNIGQVSIPKEASQKPGQIQSYFPLTSAPLKVKNPHKNLPSSDSPISIHIDRAKEVNWLHNRL